MPMRGARMAAAWAADLRRALAQRVAENSFVSRRAMMPMRCAYGVIGIAGRKGHVCLTSAKPHHHGSNDRAHGRIVVAKCKPRAGKVANYRRLILLSPREVMRPRSRPGVVSATLSAKAPTKRAQSRWARRRASAAGIFAEEARTSVKESAGGSRRHRPAPARHLKRRQSSVGKCAPMLA